jgi:hypothetical protein
LSTLLVGIAFLALLWGAVIQSVRLERERRRLAVFADWLARERARTAASLREAAAVRDQLEALLAKEKSAAGFESGKPDPAAKK